MWKRPVTWIALAGTAAGTLALTALNFGEAFPVVNLDLEVERSQVLDRARERAGAAGWGLGGYRSAAAFGLRDPEAKTYVELEAGGREAWQRIVGDGEYRPYVWTVRLFRPGETREARVRFAPDGSAEGFSLRLPEGEPGPSIPADSARALAEGAARSRWQVALDLYRPVSASQEERPGGRTDHTFVYERTDEQPGEARFRLRLTVAGDRLAGVDRFVEVPEAFTRRYAEMRSTNDFLAFVASLGAGALYLVVGCGLGLLYLLRRGLLRWRPAAVAALIVSGLLFAADLNRIPLAWIGYDTAVSETSFLVQQVGVAVLILVTGGVALTLIFSVGEGLTRRAFGDEPRLWALWSRGVANARPVLGRTLGGYLYAALAIPYVVGFYFLTTRILGWWTPAEALVQPDLLATPLPWLSAVSTALFAATNEELLFRAVPLAGAAFLGERFVGRRRLWIGAALVVQAVIFAAAHANYPQQPAYARLVELLIPSLAFGALFLRFGLLPAIVGHYTFDLAWMSLPLFTSSAPGIVVDQAFVVAAGLAPLGVVVAARIRWGARDEVAAEALNRSDREEEGPEPDARPTGAASPAGGEGLPAPRPALLLSVGAAGLVAWALTTDPAGRAPRIQIAGEEAVAAARDTLSARGASLEEPWRILPSVEAGRGQRHRYVREEHGDSTYRRLVGTYLDGPRWRVRAARFRGPVEDRAEEWRVDLDGRGRAVRIRHELPEAAPGDTLPEAVAARLARAAATRRFGLGEATIETVAAEARQRPSRRDWTFTFRDRSMELGEGQARIEVVVAGSQVVDARRFVHVPEEWRREERSRTSRRRIRALASGAVLFLLAAVAAGYAVLRWSRNHFATRPYLAVGGAVFGLLLAEIANGFPAALAQLSTSQPLGTQLAVVLGGSAFGAFLAGGFVGLLGGLGHGWGGRRPASERATLATGTALGLAVAGLGALLDLGNARRLPDWPRFQGADAAVPWIAPALGGLLALLVTGTLLLALLAALREIGWEEARSRAISAAAVVGAGFGFAGLEVGPSTLYWGVSGAVWTAVILGLHAGTRRWGLAPVPAVVGVPVLLDLALTLWRDPFPGSVAGSALGIAAVAAVTWTWTRLLARPRPPAPAPGGS